MKTTRPHSLHWIVEDIAEDPSYLEKPMFGCRACYHRGRMKLLLADQSEPWSGLLLPTEREHHASVLAEFPDLEVHPILGKWLYLSQQHEDFESLCGAIVGRVKADDPRFGILPGEGKKRRIAQKAAPKISPRKSVRGKTRTRK